MNTILKETNRYNIWLDQRKEKYCLTIWFTHYDGKDTLITDSLTDFTTAAV
jgi:hypothetical protein